MGYRMTLYDDDDHIIHDSKLFGYMSEEDHKHSRALKWLIENHKLDDYEPEWRWESCIWDYGYEHEMTLTHSEFLEFIVRYVLDRNDFWFGPETNYHDDLSYYEGALFLDHVRILWC